MNDYSNLYQIRDKRVLISAGPMRTSMDPVRYVQNRSSGRMGLEVARAVQNLGGRVAVLLGPVETAVAEAFYPWDPVRYTTATEYGGHLEALFAHCDVFLSMAAVLDFELIPFAQKMDRDALAREPSISIPIRPVPDFVAKMASQKKEHQRVIAFAAESGSDSDIQKRAQSKMIKKKVDAIVANPVRSGLGPEAERNELWVLRPNQSVVHLGPAGKSALAVPLLETLFPQEPC